MNKAALLFSGVLAIAVIETSARTRGADLPVNCHPESFQPARAADRFSSACRAHARLKSSIVAPDNEGELADARGVGV